MTKVSVKNFQSIKKAEFEVNGFTVIIGKNNIGKSAVIRAIESALTNQAGKEFIRCGEKSTEVKIQREGLDIEWKKGTSATYKVNDIPYSKLNRAIPPPLIDAGFEKMQIGDQKISPIIASQFEPLFLINKHGGVITEVLASLYKIDTLSTADDLCQKSLRAQKTLLKTREKDLHDLQDKLDKYKDFETIKKEVDTILKEEEESREQQRQIKELTLYEEELLSLAKTIKILGAVKKLKIPDIKNFDQDISDTQWLRVKCEELENLNGLLKTFTKIKTVKIPDIDLDRDISDTQWLREKDQRLQSLQQDLKILEQVKTAEIPDLSDIETSVEEVDQLREWDNETNRLIQEIEKQKEFLKQFNIDDILSKINNLEALIKEHTDIQSIEGPFLELASEAKILRTESREITEKLEKVNTELAEIKVCPTCERPL